MALCPSVRPSQVGVRSVKTAESTELVFGSAATLDLSYTCWKVIQVSPKIRVLSSGNLSQTLDFENLATALRSQQVLSTSVDAQCDKLATVVGRRSPVYHNERPSLCTTRWTWSSASRGSVCGSWDLFKRLV